MRWTLLAALATTALLVAAAPASAEPTIDVDQVQDPAHGDLIPFVVDGSAGYDGAVAIEFMGCGNRQNGTAIPLVEPTTACVSTTPGTDVVDGDVFVGLGVLHDPVDGVSYELTLRWREHWLLTPFSCGEGFEQCRIHARGVGADGSTVWEFSTPFNTVDLPVIYPLSVVVDEFGTARVPVVVDPPAPWMITFATPVFDPDGELSNDVRQNDYRQGISAHRDGRDISVSLTDDRLDELTEDLIFAITDVQGARIGGMYGLSNITIIDDDPEPELSPIHTTLLEGNDGTTLARVGWQLQRASGRDILIDYTVVGLGDASDGTDFAPQAGTAVLPEGETEVYVDIEVIGEHDFEPTEYLTAIPTAIDGGFVNGYEGLAIATILNDDPSVDCDTAIGPGADLDWCDFSGQILNGTDLDNSTLRNANLDNAVLLNVDLAGADLTSASMNNTVLIGGRAPGADLAGSGAATFIRTNLDNARFDGDYTDSTFSHITAAGATFVGEYGSTSFPQSDLAGADLSYGYFPGATFGETICPDGQSARTTGDTCVRMQVRFTSWSWGENRPNVFTVGGPSEPGPIFAMLYAGPRFNPGVWYDFGGVPGSRYRFGPTGVETEMRTEWGTCGLDQNQDGWFCDIGWYADFAEAGLPLGTSYPCVSGTSRDGQRVWGCGEIVLREHDAPPISPPASPPASPSASPPISPGAAGALSEMMQGPVGFVATASGIGLAFLWGANRNAAVLGVRRTEEDDDEDNDAEGV